jgi:uncharacterized membrane protein YidH (DUF202 family)
MLSLVLSLILFIIGIILSASGGKEFWRLWKTRNSDEQGPAEYMLAFVFALILFLVGVCCLVAFAIWGDVSFFFGPSYGP